MAKTHVFKNIWERSYKKFYSLNSYAVEGKLSLINMLSLLQCSLVDTFFSTHATGILFNYVSIAYRHYKKYANIEE